METSPRLGLSYVLPQQAQKHVTVNESLRRLDALIQLSVRNRQETNAPADPAEGDAYIAAQGASGLWENGDGEIWVFQDASWRNFAPKPGWLVWVEDEQKLIIWTGSAWIEQSGGGASGGPTQTLDRLGVNTTADANARLAVKTDTALFSHDDITPGSGDVRMTCNKAGDANTASIVFQNDFSGRAEIGLTQSDDFSLNMSPDGATFANALVVKKDTGDIGVGAASPMAKLDVAGDAAAHSYFSKVTARIDNDTVMDVATPQPAGLAIIFAVGSSGRGNNYPSMTHAGGVFFDTGGSRSAVKSFGHSNFNVTTSPLSGTTGTDGKTTVSAQAGKLTIENRSGGDYAYVVVFLG
ncbi:MAG: DUF2793 domain-containing protein [Pseudomonadota bacterium]